MGARARLAGDPSWSEWPTVSIYRGSALEAEHILEFGAKHVAIATGSSWRRDVSDATAGSALAGLDGTEIYTRRTI
jgi:dimethylamine/trimethylamine dehydrogenase